MAKHPDVVLRLTLSNGLMVDRLIPYSGRAAELRRMEKACVEINDHVDFDALGVELVEG